MTDGEALLAAVIANSDEDTPRLAYADWLRERGEDDRAEYIRRAISGGGPRLAACGSVGSLRRVSAGFGIPPDWPGGWRAEIWRGFVESLSCPADDWLRFGDGVRRLHPVTRVVLTTMPRLAARPVSHKHTQVEIAGAWITETDGNYYHRTKRALEDRWEGVTFSLPTVSGTGGTLRINGGPPVPVTSWVMTPAPKDAPPG